jgi:hypothetical protein
LNPTPQNTDSKKSPRDAIRGFAGSLTARVSSTAAGNKWKPQKKVLGIAIGERSLLAAEIVVDDRPEVRRLAELIYPEGISLSQPAELGKLLAHFLKDNQFASRSAVIGIPLKWIVVKPKDVPPADDATVAQLLRLEAEAEFSTELKDLVYDFTGGSAATEAGRSVLLTATPKKYIDAIETMCEPARLQALAITPSAMVLGSITGASLKRNVLVLSLSPGGGELSSQREATATAVRSLRPATPEPPFVSELRRAVSTLIIPGSQRELILWDGAGIDAASLGRQLDVTISPGELPSLGVDTAQAGANGQGAKYAAAVALALCALDAGPGIDFLHSRLAPPREHRIPRWAYIAMAGVLLLIGICIYAYTDLERQQKTVDGLQSQITAQQKEVDAAGDFVSKATLAQYWHGGDARYLACMRDLDNVIPEDGQTYATSLDIKAQTPPLAQGGAPPAPGSPVNADASRILTVTLQGHTANLESVTALVDLMRRNTTAFTDIKIGPETKVPRTQEFLFSITFNYVPPKPMPVKTAQAK